MAFGCRAKEHVSYSGPRPILRILRYPDALRDLICRGEAYAMDLLGQRVRVLLHCLDGEIAVRLVNAYRSTGTDSVAMQEDHNLAYLHPLLPGIGDLLPALWADTIYGLQVGGVVANYP